MVDNNNHTRNISKNPKYGFAFKDILEDQIAEKRCGHLDNKELISREEMVIKIKDSIKARKDQNFLIEIWFWCIDADLDVSS